MLAFIVSFIVGIICIALGITNTRGNISTLHSYHTHRVSEEDRLPFGKLVGLGTIIIGCAVDIFSVLSAITLYIQLPLLIWIGTAIMIVGIIAGMAISFYAMIKYNKGIF